MSYVVSTGKEVFLLFKTWERTLVPLIDKKMNFSLQQRESGQRGARGQKQLSSAT
jgi:hypothetical protein